MLFFQQRLARNVFEYHAIFLEALPLFVRVEPIPGSSQREASFDQARDEDRTETQPAHVGGFQHPQPVAIGRTYPEGLGIKAALNLINNAPYLHALPAFPSG